MNSIQSSVLYFANSSKSKDLENLTNNLDVPLNWQDTFTFFTMSRQHQHYRWLHFMMAYLISVQTYVCKVSKTYPRGSSEPFPSWLCNPCIIKIRALTAVATHSACSAIVQEGRNNSIHSADVAVDCHKPSLPSTLYLRPACVHGGKTSEFRLETSVF